MKEYKDKLKNLHILSLATPHITRLRNGEDLIKIAKLPHRYCITCKLQTQNTTFFKTLEEAQEAEKKLEKILLTPVPLFPKKCDPNLEKIPTIIISSNFVYKFKRRLVIGTITHNAYSFQFQGIYTDTGKKFTCGCSSLKEARTIQRQFTLDNIFYVKNKNYKPQN